jgi:hypothetical protein
MSSIGPGGFNSGVQFNPYTQQAPKNTPARHAAPPASVFATPQFDSVSFSGAPKLNAHNAVAPNFDITAAINKISQRPPGIAGADDLSGHVAFGLMLNQFG